MNTIKLSTIIDVNDKNTYKVDNYIEGFKILLENEGKSFSNVNNDLGGRTIYGITERFFPVDFKNMINLKTDKERYDYALDFYFREFWYKYKVYNYSYPINIVILDSVVNSGQASLTFLTKGKDTSIEEFCFNRVEYYVNLVRKRRDQIKFLVGWLNRVIKMYDLYHSKS